MTEEQRALKADLEKKLLDLDKRIFNTEAKEQDRTFLKKAIVDWIEVGSKKHSFEHAFHTALSKADDRHKEFVYFTEQFLEVHPEVKEWGILTLDLFELLYLELNKP